jgi:hypothetical protein
MGADISVPVLGDGMSLSDAAVAYAGAGWYVLPIRRALKHAGSILGEGWPNKSSLEAAEIMRWFDGRDLGIALHVGRSGAIAFDVDEPGALPPLLAQALAGAAPPFQSTRADVPGRGHYLFRQPDGLMLGNSKGQLQGGWGDVRGRNGIVVVQPTLHEKSDRGGRYRWLRTGALPTLPRSLVRALSPHATSGAGSRPSLGRPSHASEGIAGLVRTVLTADRGARNSTVFWAACRAGELACKGLVRPSDAVGELVAAGMQIGLSQAELVGYDGRSGTVFSGLRTGMGTTT